MIRDKYKLKFARYVADVAANEPDSRPVPEWFVENLLRNYLNQKFLLDPPLPIKQGTEEEEVTTDNEGSLNEQDFSFSKKSHDDTQLNVSSDALINYLDTRHREKLIKELTPTLSCIVYNCFVRTFTY